MATLAICLMSASAFAFDGKVGELTFSGVNGNLVVPIVGAAETKTYLLVSNDAEMKKAMVAALLTAKTANMDVTAYPGTANGTTGWIKIILK